MKFSWHRVGLELERKLADMDEARARGERVRVNCGQSASLRTLALRLPDHGAILADEVGMGKTRIATELAESVLRCGGRVAIVAPAGLSFQWKRELHESKVACDDVLRSVVGFGHALAECEEALPHWSQPVLLLSHAFGTLRIREKANPVRWSLLPALAAVMHPEMTTTQRQARHRRIRRVRDLGDHGEVAIKTAQALAAALQPQSWPWLDDFAKFRDEVTWESLMDPSRYQGGSEHRRWLHRVIGLGLGRFDLVLIDEAHKSRGDDSSLSVVLEDMLWLSPWARRVCMTATPVELDAEQWLGTLRRIGVDAASASTIDLAIKGYAAGLRDLRAQWRSNEASRRDFAEAATAFQKALGDYVLRRDKRSDDAVKLFMAHGGEDYRDRSQKVVIDTDELAPPWKRALCAAEALSVIHVPDDQATKRLRLTFASGHGSSAFMNSRQHGSIAYMDGGGERPLGANDQPDLDRDCAPADAEVQPDAAAPQAAASRDATAKRRDRQAWWRSRLEAALRQVPDSRFGHPAITACVRAIEARTGRGEKVLVFGSYNEPMSTLVNLLNARQMLRNLEAGAYWPQSGLGAEGDATDPNRSAAFRTAVAVALRQWQEENGQPFPAREDQLDARLKKQFEAEHNRRESFRSALATRLDEGLAELEDEGDADDPDHKPLSRVYRHVLENIQRYGSTVEPNGANLLTLVARNLLDQTGDKAHELQAREITQEFIALVDATLDQDQIDGDDAEDDEDRKPWMVLWQRLNVDASSQRGGFARFMYSGTPADTRRRIQHAFNRLQAYPMVLVAQSRVGREGLNLHEACSVVMLMHPEWNPAVVEQQIGRVDRVNSLWSRRLHEAVHAADPGTAPAALPRIEVMPVVFRGTYDEHQWTVLNERWDDLRAQLHGEVLPQALRPAQPTPAEREAMDFLERCAPRFSP